MKILFNEGTRKENVPLLVCHIYLECSSEYLQISPMSGHDDLLGIEEQAPN